MKKKFCAVFLSVALIAGIGMETAFSATVGIRDADQGDMEIWVEPCTYFDVELYLDLSAEESALIEDNGIVGYTVDVTWDPLVELIGYEGGPLYTYVDVYVAGTSSSPETPWVGEKLEAHGWNFGTAIETSHVLETFSLHCLALGDTDLIPEGHFAVTETKGNFALNDGSYLENVMTVDYQGITIHQTPIPATLLLLGSGLVALVCLRRKRAT